MKLHDQMCQINGFVRRETWAKMKEMAYEQDKKVYEMHSELLDLGLEIMSKRKKKDKPSALAAPGSMSKVSENESSESEN